MEMLVIDGNWIYVLLFLSVIQSVFGSACMSIANKKGYPKYFATGFFFGVFGLLYVIGLPESEQKQKDKLDYLAKATAEEIAIRLSDNE